MRRVLGTLLLLSACSLDTTIPDQPQRGRIVGVLDTSDGVQPPEGWTITLSSDKGDQVTTVTTSGGAFLFSDLPPGLYLASAQPEGYAKVTSDLLRVRSGLDTDAGVLKPAAKAKAIPPLQFGSLLAKVIGEMGANIAGAKVEFIQGTVAVDQTLIAADGLLSKLLPPGNYKLRVSHPFFVSPPMVTITIDPMQTTDITAMPLTLSINPATLEGTVFKQSVTDGGSPASGATVTLDTGETTAVDVAGHFSLAGLAAGPRQVRVTMPSFHDPIEVHAVELVPAMTATLDPVTLVADLGGIRGQVQTGDGAPVSGARVEISGLPLAALVSPDPADPTLGTFLISGVPLGTWPVSAGKDQYSRSNATGVLTHQGEIVDVGLLKLSRLQGDFLIEDSDPLNTPGYTRTPAVTLNFTGFPPSGVVSYRASEDPSFDGGTFKSYTGPMQAFTLAPGEGTHTVYAQYTDNMGQQSQPFSATVVLDTVAPATPTVTFQATGNAGATKYSNLASNIPLTIVSNDGTGSGLSKMRVGPSVDGMGNVSGAGVAYAVTTVFPSMTAPNGPLQVYVQVVDNAGNASVAGTDSITIDTSAPTGSISIAKGAQATDVGYTSSPLVTLTETASDGANSVVLVKLANTSADLASAVYQPVSATATWFLDPNGDGTKSVFMRFRDAAGNESPPNMMPATIIYDTKAPSPAAIALVTPAITRSPMVTVSLTTNVTDLSSTQAVTLSDESTFTSAATTAPAPYPMSAQASLTLPAGDGVRTVYARFRDKAGNDAITSVSLTLDTVPPQGSFTLTGALGDGTPSSTLTSTNQVTVTLVPGGASEYRLGDSTMTTCPSTGYTTIVSTTLTNQTLPANGIVTLCLRDAAGNAQGPLSQSITLDSTAPSGCSVALSGSRVDGNPAPAGLTAQQVVTANLTCAGATELYLSTTSVTCSNALPYVPYAAAQVVTVPSVDGPKTVYGCVRDAARNVGTLSSGMLTLDTAGPSPVSATLVGASLTNAASVTLTLSATDPAGLGTSDAVTASEDPFFTAAGTVGPSAYPAGNQVTVPLSSTDGVKTIYVRFRDRLGNESFQSATVTRDATPPTGSIVVEGNLADGTPSQDYATTFGGNPPTVKVYVTQVGATQYAVIAGAMTCASATYTALSGTTVSATLQVAGATGTVTLCLKDAAGNPSAALSDTITFDSTGPTGCTLALAGLRADGTTAAPAGQSAKAVVTATLQGCNAGTTEFYLANGTASCSPLLTASWQGYSAPSSVPFLLAGEGSNTVSGCVRDAARNVTAITGVPMTLDTTPPAALGIAINGGAPYFNLSQQTGGMNVVSVLGQATGATEWALSEGTPSAFVAFSGAAGNFTLTGDGAHTIHAVFRDALWNQSTAVSASITVDTTPPAAAPVPTLTPATGYTPSASIVVHVTPPADADTLQLAQAAGGACVAGDFGGAPQRGLTGDYTFVLAGSEGSKHVCARTLDNAGNASGIGQADIVLDVTPPTTPRVTTGDTVYLGLDGGTSYTVNLVGPVTDTYFSAYQTRNMAQSAAWATASTNINTTSFAFPLTTDGGVTGTLNQLRVRAVDLAGNASEESFVNVVLDTSPPPAVTTSVDWVDNGDRRATVFWQPSTAADVVRYKIYYDSVSVPNAPLQGTYANEGPSPVVIGLQNTITLSGLTNEAQTIVRIAAVDQAGNEGPMAPTVQPYITLRPNDISPNGVPPLTLPNAARIERIVIDGDLAYVMGLTNCSSPAPGARNPILHVVDISKMQTAIQTGTVVASPGSPTLLTSYTFPETVACPPTQEVVTDALIDGPWLFVAETDRVVFFDRSQPATLTAKGTVQFPGWTINSLALIGQRLVISGKTNVAVLILDKLYDGDPTSLPVAADVTGTATNGYSSAASIQVARDRAIQIGQQGTTYVWNLTDALDAPAAGTVWDNTDMQGFGAQLDALNAHGIVGGNFLFTGSWAQGFNVYDVTQVWAGTSTFTTAGAAAYNVQNFQSDVSGALAFLPSTGGGRIIDLGNLAEPQSRALYGSTQQGTAAIAGLYTLGGISIGNTLITHEIATPRGPHVVQTGIGSGFRPTIAAGLIYTESGVVFDATSGSSLTVLRTGGGQANEGCTTQSAFFDDVEVMTVGNGYRVVDLEKETDRNPATTGTVRYDVTPLAAGTRATGAARWGNFLVTAEVRPAGVFLRVFKAIALRDRQAATSFALTDLIGELQISPLNAANVIARITMNRGRAVVALESGATDNNVIIVDLRRWFDDDATTAVDATYIQGVISTGSAFDAKVQGNWVYAATVTGVEVINVSQAFDEDKTTLVPASPSRTTLSPFMFATQYTSIDVSGSYVAAVRGGAFDFYDVSTPLTQRLVSSTAIQATVTGCSYPLGGGSFLKWPTVTLAGGRVYFQTSQDLFVYDLE